MSREIEDVLAARSSMADFIRSQLVGPAEGECETIADPPNRRYLMGTLFPVDRRPVDASADEDVLISESDSETDPPPAANVGEKAFHRDNPVESSTRFLPSSLGITFYTAAETLEVTVSAGRYMTQQEDEPAQVPNVTSKRQRSWRRVPMPDETMNLSSINREENVFSGRGRVDVRWRRHTSGSIVTLTLCNTAETTSTSPDKMWDEMLFQCAIHVTALDGEILEYPSLEASTSDEEAQELRLQYSKHKTFAIGHGTAVHWDTAVPLHRVRTEVLPHSLVPGVSTKLRDDFRVSNLAFDINRMADPSSSRNELLDSMNSLVDEYGRWSDELARESDSFSGLQNKAAIRIVRKVRKAAVRMRSGVQVLRENENAWHAFQLANHAMRMQYQRGRPEFAGLRRTLAEPADLSATAGEGRAWRPFQIGFFLHALEGLVDEQSVDRSTVDLIWFPTGGGKTEAYLLLATFVIFYRRIADPIRGAGTAILSRYTLSLLTTQQFQRAAGAIVACEWIRRQDATLGNREISIGLWVGEATTDNKFTQALATFNDVRQQAEPEDKFLLERCPWCGTEIVPKAWSAEDGNYGINATSTSFQIYCPRVDCEFHNGLPVHVIDEALYEAKPSFVLGTVDKFADLAWESRGGVFFGDSGNVDPPSLIIQDELHLLSGPLGTTVGLYEHSLQMLCENQGCPPKVVASTATVRRAEDQVSGLFGRSVAMFPPAGLSEDDSFFARKDSEGFGRLYVGVMPQGHTADTATVLSLTTLLQAPVALELQPSSKDLYWTVVAYHNSLQELGRTVTISRDDVPGRLDTLFGEEARLLPGTATEELTANVDRAQQPRLLERLGKRYDQAGSISVLAATNMISVGVDVPRLGLMLVNGQPKGTSEYIQATSRVGRELPGLVLSLFRPTRPRDRSHYETFQTYHSTLYKNVEPTSVTPYAPPSQLRSLHAALVILVRHHLGLSSNADASQVFPAYAKEVDALVERLVDIANAVDEKEAARVRTALQGYVDEWKLLSNENESLVYRDSSNIPGPRLLCDFGESGGWPTLRSMRNVDNQTPLRVSNVWKGRKRR